MQALLLASSSPYRRELLQRLQLPFSWASPDIDESARDGETGAQLVRRLAESKARALTARYPEHCIIGSDQVAQLDGRILGKPGNPQQAEQQLLACSDRRVDFLTGLCVYDPISKQTETHVELFQVCFRPLQPAQIQRYLAKEQPYDCAGSFRMEGLGISLFQALIGRDPNSLIGLPLIALIDMLQRRGYAIP